MTPSSELKNSLNEQLERESASLSSLLDVLQQEAAALNANLADEVGRLAGHKETLVKQLQVIASDRNHWLQQAGLDITRENVLSGISKVDASDELAQKFTQNLSLARLCQETNFANGIHINKQEQFHLRSFNVLTGSGDDAALYTYQGSADREVDQHFLGNA